MWAMLKSFILMFLLLTENCSNSKGQTTDGNSNVGAGDPNSYLEPDIIETLKCNASCTEDSCHSYSAVEEKHCHCDEICTKFKDCCHGFEICRNVTQETPGVLEHVTRFLPYMRCEDIITSRGYIKFQLISKCPKGFRDDEIAKRCLFSPRGWKGVPLTDGIVSFKNINCAICHEKWKDVEPWTLKRNCNTTNCKFYFYDEPDETLPIFKSYSIAVRPCFLYRPTPIQECSMNESDHLMNAIPISSLKSCGIYNVPLKYGKRLGIQYKDVNCFLCNGLNNATNVSCSQPVFKAKLSAGHGSGTSLKVLLDTSQLTATVCTEWDLFDVDLGECQPVVCSEGYIFNNGDCRKLVYLTLNFSNDSQLPTETTALERQLMQSIGIGSSENSPLGSKESTFLDTDAGVVAYEARSNPALAFMECTEKHHVALGSRERRNRGILANISKEPFWKISGDDATLNLTSFLCANASSLSCPKVLYPKESYEWKDDTPIIGQSFYLQPNQFEIVEDYVFICRDALIEKWSLFQGFMTDDRIQGIATLIGSSLSLAGLAYTFLTYTLLSPLRTLPGKMLMHLCVALFLAQLLFLTGLNRTTDQGVCKAIAMVEHYLWLASFLWMNAISWNTMKTFSSNGLKNHSKKRKSLLFGILYSWGTPCLIVMACAVIEFTTLGGFRVGYGNTDVCWISNPYALLFAFALPVGLVILGNTFMFSYTVYNIFRVTQVAKLSKAEKENHQRIWLYVKLSSVMGLTWMFGFLASFVGSPALWYVFIVFNTTQGVLIGAGFSMNKRIIRMYSSEYSVTSSFKSDDSAKSNCMTISSVS
ncbi:uncharacterized protein LOC135489799 isoform X2 [Lineus longissimus]|uniref:uncharacterized protein LOC135489799 isoform X2 n=1 Tax=Lineus longissimus TaxID=88925 RepID=UPI00315DB22F